MLVDFTGLQEQLFCIIIKIDVKNRIWENVVSFLRKKTKGITERIRMSRKSATGKRNPDGVGLRRRSGRITCVGISLFFLGSALGLQAAARQIDGFADWYGRHIYRVLVETEGRLYGLFPISVGEILVYLVGVLMIGGTVWAVAGCVRRDGMRRLQIWGKVWVMVVSAAFFLYTTQCGINYFRTPFSVEAGYVLQPSTAAELERLCLSLTEEINAAATQLNLREEKRYERPADLERQAQKAMQQFGTNYDCLNGLYPLPKPILGSVFFSYQYITGIYCPFTIEANYNKEIPDVEVAAVMCHELSHLSGLMREEEANLIAYLACRESGNPHLQYSGAMFAYGYCMNALYDAAGAKRYQEIYGQLCPSAILDRQFMSQWWKQYDTPVREVSRQINDTYLQANAQKEGTKSYGRMVDLLLAEQRAEGT